MEIEIITTSAINTLDSTRNFGLFLTKSQSIIHMVHWYSLNYNVHEILGNLYESLDPLFDKLQEEIIGTVRNSNVIFPMFNSTTYDMDNISLYRDDEALIVDTYYNVYKNVTDVLTSIEFKNYTTQVKSGINNTIEEIISTFNKANYLLGLVKN
jgi:DNA-binding ferritin-like protein